MLDIKIPTSAFKAFFSLLMILIFLCYRYLSIGIPVDQVVVFASYFFFSSTVLAVSFIRFKDSINPVSIYCVFVFLMSYSFIRLSFLQSSYSVDTIVLLNLSIVSYLCFAFVDYPYKPVFLFSLSFNLRRIFLYTIILGSLITFCIECALFGYLPVLHIASADVYIETNAKLVPFLHYFIVLLAFIPAWSYIYYKLKFIGKTEYRVLLLITLFILVNYLSRQLYLLLGITFFIAYSFFNHVNVKAILRVIIAVFSIFMIVGYLKFNSDVGTTFSEFSRILAGIDNDQVNIFESTLTEYSSKRFTALNKMVIFSDYINYHGFGSYTFRPLLSFFLLEKTGVIERIPDLNSEVNVGTYAIDPYLDFGFLGVIMINALYGFLALRYYKQYKKSYPEAVIKFSIIVFCILMGMFINYFNTMLIWLGILFNKILLGGMQKNEELQ